MKILYFHQHFSTPLGSLGTRSYEMARALIRAGHEVTIICGAYKGGVTGISGDFKGGRREGMVDDIRVIELQLSYSNHQGLVKRSMIFMQFALLSVVIALREPCDLIFASTTPLTAGLPGIFARWFRRKKFVFEVRDLWPELPREMGVVTNPVILGLLSALEWGSYHSAHACIGLSPGIVEGIKKRSPCGQPVTMIPNGCDFELFNDDEVSPKRPPGVDKDDFVAIFTGAHGIANGLEAVLKAAEVLKQRGRDEIKLVFIGDGKLKSELKETDHNNRLNNCIFLDPVPKGELVAYMKGADIGLMILDNIPAFYYGTSPNKFFDYLSIGLPVLNNYPGWLAGVIREYGCGYAVEPRREDLFADALEKAFNSPHDLQKMGKQAQKAGRDLFAREDLAAEFVAWIEKTAEISCDE